MQDNFHSRTTGLAVVEVVALIALPGAALAQASVPSRAAARPGPRLLTAASWHGRTIRRPETARPASIRAHAPGTPGLRVGTGFLHGGGSDRVRDVQRRLTRLGYRPGRADGLYGPRTQAAVTAFQRKHHLPRSGNVGPATRDALRQRTSGQAPRVTSASLRAPRAVVRTHAPSAVHADATGGGLGIAQLLLLGVCTVGVVCAGRYLRPEGLRPRYSQIRSTEPRVRRVHRRDNRW